MEKYIPSLFIKRLDLSPQVIMVFEALSGGDIEEVIEENKAIVYRHGYFDSANPEHAKLVTKSFKSLQKFSDDKIK